MAVKLLSSDWLAAERENKQLRDSHRRKFWDETGIVPAGNTSEIDLDAAECLAQIQGLIETTLGGKEADPDLASITRAAGSMLADIAPGSFSHHASGMGLDMAQLSPKFLRAFFLSPDLTSYEVSETD